jgi:hypothetical protein
LGYHFEELIVLLAFTCSMPIEESSNVWLLSEVVKEGLIKKSGDGYLSSHDKVQSAFKSLIDETDGAQLHLVIGKVYLTTYD